MSVFGLSVVVVGGGVVGGGLGLHCTPAASVLWQSWVPQPSNLNAKQCFTLDGKRLQFYSWNWKFLPTSNLIYCLLSEVVRAYGKSNKVQRMEQRGRKGKLFFYEVFELALVQFLFYIPHTSVCILVWKPSLFEQLQNTNEPLKLISD